MKGFFKWLKSNAKIKRWIFLILIGIVCMCYGIAIIIDNETLQIDGIIKIVCSFVIGCTIIVIATVHMQKRMLELLVEESDTRKEKSNVNTLIFNKKVYDQGPNVVVIGGGSGLNTVLRGLKNYTDNITAIVTVSDYGDENADVKNVSVLEDIKGSIAALANDEDGINDLFNYKFEEKPAKGYSFGYMYFSAMNGLYGNFSKAVESSKGIFNITGRVLPVTLEPIKICAELNDGTVVENRNKIPEMVGKATKKIARTFIYPTNAKPAPGVLEAIKKADAIVIGPGSLFTNVIPNLLVRGVARAIKESNAIKVYVSNIMTEFGQTDEYSLSDYIKTIQEYLGGNIIDYCIYDTGEIIPEFIHKYNLEGSDIVLPDTSKAKQLGVKLIQRNLSVIDSDTIRHDPDVIASTIIQLICDELSFADMENNSQFMKLNNKLKETKREIKKRQKADNKFKKSGRKPFERRDKSENSRFRDKYKDRIKSIKESDKIKNRIRIAKEEIQEKEAKEQESKK